MCHKFHDIRRNRSQALGVHSSKTPICCTRTSPADDHVHSTLPHPGKELLIADTLSRSPLSDPAKELEFNEYDIDMLHTIPITDQKLDELKRTTDSDLSDLTQTVLQGWPTEKSEARPGARPFWNYRDEITYHHGVLFKGSRVIIPTSMRSHVLKLIHSMHLGVEKCKKLARDTILWPGLGSQIEDMVNNCDTCSQYKRSNPREPLMLHPTPHRPWETVGLDLCELKKHHYLIIVDYYSNFIEVDELHTTTSEQVVAVCKSQFARHGIPNTVISDNGPQFASQTFHEFSLTYQFQHHTSSPYHPQSNGKAEKAVQVVKGLLNKTQSDTQDFHLALLNFRNTPMNDELGSPAQRLMGRRTRTLIPTTQKRQLESSQNLKSNVNAKSTIMTNTPTRCLHYSKDSLSPTRVATDGNQPPSQTHCRHQDRT